MCDSSINKDNNNNNNIVDYTNQDKNNNDDNSNDNSFNIDDKNRKYNDIAADVMNFNGSNGDEHANCKINNEDYA